MSLTVIGIIGVALLVILLFTKVPVAFVMLLVGIVGFGVVINFNAALHMAAKDLVDTFTSYGLTVIPLFILMGQLAFHGGISGRLFNTAYKFMGHLPGGLAIATVGACAGFAAICGSTNATAATMASGSTPSRASRSSVIFN